MPESNRAKAQRLKVEDEFKNHIVVEVGHAKPGMRHFVLGHPTEESDGSVYGYGQQIKGLRSENQVHFIEAGPRLIVSGESFNFTLTRPGTRGMIGWLVGSSKSLGYVMEKAGQTNGPLDSWSDECFEAAIRDKIIEWNEEAQDEEDVPMIDDDTLEKLLDIGIESRDSYRFRESVDDRLDDIACALGVYGAYEPEDACSYFDFTEQVYYIYFVMRRFADLLKTQWDAEEARKRAVALSKERGEFWGSFWT